MLGDDKKKDIEGVGNDTTIISPYYMHL